MQHISIWFHVLSVFKNYFVMQKLAVSLSTLISNHYCIKHRSVSQLCHAHLVNFFLKTSNTPL